MHWLILAFTSCVTGEVISVFGSSVANGFPCGGNCSGTASSSDDGGCYQSRWRVFQRARNRTVVNNARNGDTTVALLGRFDEMLSVSPKYVLIGLSLANEGIMNGDPQGVFDQYATNMQQLINQSRAHNITPILASCYPNNGYGPTEYDYITKMNILSQSWGVSQVNILGTIDTGTGKWADGFWADGLHPNDLGSTLMYRAFVPTLIEAIEAGKSSLISRVTDRFAILNRFSLSGFALSFNVSTEVPMFPWATGLWLRAQAGSAPSGQVLLIDFEGSSVQLSVQGGKLEYKGTVTSGQVDDGNWHHVVISHKWATQQTTLYLNGNNLTQIAESISPVAFSLGVSSMGATVDLREWTIYRSSLSQAEVSHMLNASLVLPASLEVYGPLDPAHITANHAQSMAELTATLVKPTVDISVFGSSVANGYLCSGNCSGVSSSNETGGCYQSRLRVFQSSLNRTIFNNCRNSDSTTLLLGRFSEMLSVNPKHVLIGLSLANEGLSNPSQNPQQVFDQYAAGMQQLIMQSRANNIIPFIGSCYPNNAYNSTQYEYITRMNILSQSWGVPQINFLGAVDDGAGRWSSGYFSNAGHPNDEGSTLLYHAIVPSLLEAIAAGKSARVQRKLDFAPAAPVSFASLTFTTWPQASIFSWAISISFRALNASHPTGSLLTVNFVNGSAEVSMQAGWMHHRNVSSQSVDDGNWHTLVLSHNYASNTTTIYLDGMALSQVAERVQPIDATLLSPPKGVEVRDWIIYRSSLNQAEVSYLLNSSDVLQASLEVYAPLDPANLTANWAQSMSTLSLALPGVVEPKSRTSDYIAVGVFIGVLSLVCLALAMFLSHISSSQAARKARVKS